MTVFNIDGYFVDDPDSSIDGSLVAEFDNTPDGYSDDQIFYYGLSETDIQEAIKTGEAVGNEFVITAYSKESE